MGDPALSWGLDQRPLPTWAALWSWVASARGGILVEVSEPASLGLRAVWQRRFAYRTRRSRASTPGYLKKLSNGKVVFV